ncbi:MAG: translin family protein [Candidatus Lokiarchaeota archaeon]|nr:translin family protein [Candidatus Lokiarchaeota archaeon]
MRLNKIFSELSETLDKLDQDREKILKLSRMIIRDCSIAIKNIHRKDFDQYHQKLQNVKKSHNELLDLVNNNPGVFLKHLKTPEQEYAEAVAFYSIISKESLPLPSELNIMPLNYALGLADVIGELRRYALDNIRNSIVKDLNYILENMDDIYTHLFSMDYPSGLTQDLRHKTDQARSIIEKTRGDVSISLQMSDLKKCMQESEKKQP